MASATGLNPSTPKGDKDKDTAAGARETQAVPEKRVMLASTISTTSHSERHNSHLNDFMDTIRQVRGVAAVMMMDKEGRVGKSNFDKATSGMYCGLASQILQTTIPLIQKLSPKNRLHVIRSNGGGQELIIAPISNHDLSFVILQNCADRESIASNSLKSPEEKRRHKVRATITATVAGAQGHTSTTAAPGTGTGTTGGGAAAASTTPSASVTALSSSQNQNQPQPPPRNASETKNL